ncbi:ATP-dependent DNA helicase RecG [Methylobacillus rhizosphaerae]|uniref:ATP-dependent DNA helicase RecG n=1 Tax=Methylobacillus rhizosphaerae TaxID=551994 RepID=A0A238ZGM0_9PROT|nr:ATP-dependent DNA helicase RecG [Methylobacillus rhizosphaerae]SNR81863.1 ATP-dependent DNA helicase RecG [Methylobacillus rhizosphaerae]
MALKLPANTKLSDIKGITPALQGRLAKLGISNLQGLLLHLPLRYLDETRIVPIRELRTGEQAQVQGEIVHAEVQYRPRKSLICRLKDETGQLVLRFLHFYPSQVASLKEGSCIRAFGEVRGGFFGWEMVHPQCRKVAEDTPVAEALTPLYPTTAGLSQASLQKWVAFALQQAAMDEILPAAIYQHLGLPAFADSLHQLHHPAANVDLASLESRDHPAWRRLAFDELLAQQLSMRQHHERRKHQGAPALAPSDKLITALLRRLPFALTQAQQRVALEIGHDLQQAHPMQRLLQGDVGSGKTIVAAMAALQAIENGWQAAIMAPTEILAEQHYQKMQDWLHPLGIQVAWLSGSQGKKERRAMLESVANGEAQLVIGTHALFQEHVVFQRLALAIVDEQHRFGVQQRLSLRQKGGQPHQLMMSATPIPRTLSMSYFADLDVSVIDELPPGRTPVVTRLVSDARREEVLERVQQACMEGRQAYWVCPLIEESEALQLQTVTETFENLQATFPELRVGLVHGRMKPAEKQAVMTAFSTGETQLLVATTVIEVGVDVPNASLMVIEHAERMGLSQLHQLRGRVGRGAAKSSCILLYQDGRLSETARARLKIIYESSDGFAIAQADLALRGPGEFMGVRQSGVPMLKIADLERDQDLLEAARSIAAELLAREPRAAEMHLARWLGHAEELVKV